MKKENKKEKSKRRERYKGLTPMQKFKVHKLWFVNLSLLFILAALIFIDVFPPIDLSPELKLIAEVIIIGIVGYLVYEGIGIYKSIGIEVKDPLNKDGHPEPKNGGGDSGKKD